MREAFSLDPGSGTSYYSLVGTYFELNRLEEVRATAAEAQAKTWILLSCALICTSLPSCRTMRREWHSR